jgi:hypothetical protein
MAFVDDILRHAEQIKVRLPHLRGEEATKHSLVIPLLQLLGWDPFDPQEVTPEYVADFATKRAGQLEKIDYAVFASGSPIVFVECKAHDRPLEDHAGQLARYFNSTPTVRVAVLTNGVQMSLFTDLHQTNLMDSTPWIEIDLLSPGSIELEALRRLRKGDFSSDDMTAYAERTVYFRKMADYVAAALREPSESFVRFVAGEVFPSVRLMPKVVERLAPILKDAIQTAVLDSVAKSLAAPPTQQESPPVQEAATAPADESSAADKERGVETTAEELRCFELISRFIREVHSDASVCPRDSQTYFAVNQGSTRTWFLRFNVQRPPFWLALRHVSEDEIRKLAPGLEVISASGFGDSRVALGCVEDVQKLRSAIIAAYAREAARGTDDSDSATGQRGSESK